ncbi:MAG TPA: BrnA antitoxin family protein [Rhizomicrobium sp.]|nr:BrnA antitoxin family protein [Rhizomicrobium sp.]
MSGSKGRPKHISQEDWNAVDSPPLTAEQWKHARPFKEVMPEFVEAWRRSRGRPRTPNPKTLVSLRLDSDVLDAFKAEGPGWQTRINKVLSDWARRHKRAA